MGNWITHHLVLKLELMNLPPPSDVFESLRSFRANSLFCDVCLRYPDSLEFRVHRVVIAAASPYLREQLLCEDGVQVCV